MAAHLDDFWLTQLLPAAKNALRIEAEITKYDDELRGLIRACQSDIYGAGADEPIRDSSRFRMAAILYCKAYFGEGDERFERSYQMLRDSMASSGECRVKYYEF